MVFFVLCVIALAAYAVLVFFANRWHRPILGTVAFEPTGTHKPAETTLSVTTWNIGYAGLGAKADFLVDGGRHLRALSRQDIDKASHRIARHLAACGSQVLLVQENAEAGFLTRGIHVRNTLGTNLKAYGACFWSDFETVRVPPPLRIRHGMTTYSKLRTDECSVLPLPEDTKRYYGCLSKHYGGILSRHPIAGSDFDWVVINIHLSAFDQDAALRKRQIAALFALANAEYRRGHHVVIGGDWNMRLLETSFPHQTDPKHLFWIFDFPQDLLPSGWRFATDPAVPTVRTLHEPFAAGDTYTTIIDGFVVSPNVDVVAVATEELGFADTDHHPVSAKFAARPVPDAPN